MLRQGGRLVIAVWDSLEQIPGYAALTKLLERLFGDEARKAMEAPFVMGDTQILQSLFNDIGVESTQIQTQEGTACFPSIKSWLYTEVKGWTLAEMIDDAQYELLLELAENELQQFVTQEGKVAFRLRAHIITVTKSIICSN